MEIPFWKMHGASNDFILVDDRKRTFPARDQEWVARIASRRTGVGCEGIILIQPSEKADFRMRFFNPDGGEVEMCGNGARCVARLAHEIGAAPLRMQFETMAGIVGAEVSETAVRLEMTEPKDWKMNGSLDVDGKTVKYDFVNSGVAHVVVQMDDIDSVDVMKLGSAIRYHTMFAPSGTNANFIQITGKHSLRVRTYERGVENETLACGTGMVAAGLIAGKKKLVEKPVEVTPASGDVLEVDFELTKNGATDVTLTGPAEHVFQGTLEYH